jgi:hypothetical protein
VAVAALFRRDDGAAVHGDHELQAVADAQHRHAGFQRVGVRAGRALAAHAVGAARQDDAGGLGRGDLLPRGFVWEYLAVHLELAQPPRDQLGILAPEVENEDLLGLASRDRHYFPIPMR